MKKLSRKEYWDLTYKYRDSIFESEALERKRHPSKKSHIKILIKKLIGEKVFKYMLRSYADYLLWNVIYKKYMPKIKGAKILEIGSAPGDHLVRLSKVFGFIPYGIEYSESGVKLNRKAFISHNINPDNVIHGDFLSNEFHKKYKGCFDIVVSHGFIEHFTEVDEIIEKHINLLTKGGYLIVSIPNFRGVNYILAWIFHREFLSMHNISIMQKREFSRIFDKKGLLTLFCDYYGTFTFWLFNAPLYKLNSSILKRFLLSICNNLQLILNMVFRLLFRDKGAENRLFSPYLIFVGVKKG